MASIIIGFLLSAYLIAAILSMSRFKKKQVRKKEESEDILMANDINAPIALLRRFSESGSARVREAVVSNPKCPIDILESLAHDKNGWVVLAVSENVATPSEVLEIIISKPPLAPTYIRERAIMNPNLEPSALVRFSISDENDVRYAVSRNTKTPKEVLARLMSDSDWHVRLGVAGNPESPPETLRALIANEKDSYLKEVAEKNLKNRSIDCA